MDHSPAGAPTGVHAPNTTAPLVANVAGLLLCLPFGLAGLLVAVRARRYVPGDLPRARRLTRVAWLLFVPSVLIVLFFFGTQPEATLSLLGF